MDKPMEGLWEEEFLKANNLAREIELRFKVDQAGTVATGITRSENIAHYIKELVKELKKQAKAKIKKNKRELIDSIAFEVVNHCTFKSSEDHEIFNDICERHKKGRSK